MSFSKSVYVTLSLTLVVSPRLLSAEKIVISDGPSAASSAKGTSKSGVADPNTSTLATYIPAQNAAPMGKNAIPASKVSAQTARPVEKSDGFFYVYTDRQMAGNHFIPSGWMGDTRDIALDDNNRENPHSGSTCIKITYNTKRPPENGWAGMYWQNPANNWGEKKGGYNLSKYHQLTFWVRGAKGGENIGLFKIGGIAGTHGDTGSAEFGPVILTKTWALYTIDLKGQDLSTVIGGFSWSASREDNPEGFQFYLDDIRYE